MRLLDFSHSISSSIPVFPGDPSPGLDHHCTIEKDGFLETRFDISSHTGTHIDAPAHMLRDGLTLDQMELEHFMGKAITVDVRGKSVISPEDLAIMQNFKGKVDFLLIYTGWSRYWDRKEKYLSNFPVISRETASFLTSFSLKGVGMDTISIDALPDESFPVHKILMKSNILIIENLTNLDQVTRIPEKRVFDFFCIPLSFNQADGSPVRAIGTI